MTTMFDVLGYPGKSAFNRDNTNLNEDQAVALHQARSVCQLLMVVANPLADVPIAHSIGFEELEGTFWLLRDLLDKVGELGEISTTTQGA